MKKVLIVVMFFVLMSSFAGCMPSTETVNKQTLQNQQQTPVDTYNGNVQTKEYIDLTTENITEYLRIDLDVTDISITRNNGFNPPMHEGNGRAKIKTTPLKRGDFENVEITLQLYSDRGWDNESVTLVIPFNGTLEHNEDLLTFNTYLPGNPYYELRIKSVTGKFVK